MSNFLFLDIDGTLVTYGKQKPSDETIAALKKARENGTKVFICTGRPRHMITNMYDATYMDGTINFNGAYIEIENQVYAEKPIPLETVHALFDLAERTNTCLSAQMYGACYMNQNNIDFMMSWGDGSDENLKFLFHHFNVKPYSEYVDAPIYKFDIHFTKKSDINAFMNEFPKGLELVKVLSMENGDMDGGEATRADATKGNAILDVLKYYGATADQAYAAGDSKNDRTMLEVCGHGIAMGNANEDLKKIAEFVTTDVDHDGVVEALKHYHLI